MIVRELQKFLKYLQRGLMRSQPLMKALEAFQVSLGDPQRLIRMSCDLHMATCTCNNPNFKLHCQICLITVIVLLCETSCLTSTSGLSINITHTHTHTPLAEAGKFYSQSVQRWTRVWDQYLDCVMKVRDHVTVI